MCTIKITSQPLQTKMQAKGGKRKRPSSASTAGPVIALAFTSPATVLLARDSAVKPGFQTRNLHDANGMVQKEILLEPYTVELASASSAVDGKRDLQRDQRKKLKTISSVTE